MVWRGAYIFGTTLYSPGLFLLTIFLCNTGYYEIEGCEGVNPTLHMTVGRTYLFDQSDDSNWYHLIGFAVSITHCRREKVARN